MARKDHADARLRAATALRGLRLEARKLAEADAPQDPSQTTKSKAVRSAFVSRQRGRHYAVLLAEHVRQIEAERDQAALRNQALRDEIACLRQWLAAHERLHAADQAAAAFTRVLDGVIEEVGRVSPRDDADARLRPATAIRALCQQARDLAEGNAPRTALQSTNPKAVRSAFISRQRKKYYAVLLAEHVRQIEAERDQAALRNKAFGDEIAYFRQWLALNERLHAIDQVAAFTRMLDGVIEEAGRKSSKT